MDPRGLRRPAEIATTGVSLGAYHAVNFALKRADLFPLAMCLSGNYDPSTWRSWGELGMQTYFNNPMAYVTHLSGDHLDWLRERVSLLLVCGQGQWEDTTGSLESTKRLAGVLEVVQRVVEVHGLAALAPPAPGRRVVVAREAEGEREQVGALEREVRGVIAAEAAAGRQDLLGRAAVGVDPRDHLLETHAS